MCTTGPIVEVAEAEEMEEDEERQSTSMITSSLTEEDYQEFLAGTVDKRESPSHQATPISLQEESPKDKEDTSDPVPSSTDPTSEVSPSTEQSTDEKQESTETVGDEAKPTPGEEETSQQTPEAEETQPDPELSESKSKGEEEKPDSEKNESQPDQGVESRSRASSVIERRLATADRYGRSAPISVMRKYVTLFCAWNSILYPYNIMYIVYTVCSYIYMV